MPRKSADQETKEVKKDEVKVEESKNEVAVKQDAAPAVQEEDYGDFDLTELGFETEELEDLTGLETINANDIRVPYGKLYAKAATNREVGDIELPDGTVIKGKDGEVLEGLSILKIQPVRVYFPEKFNKNNTFICRSLDGKVGAPDGKYAGNPCATCEFAKYPEDGGASPCREQMLLLCTLEDGTLFHLLVSGIGVREFKKTFMSVEMTRGLRIVKKKLKANVLGALNLTMGVEMEDTEYGPFPRPAFKVVKEQPMVPKERLRMNLEAFSSYKDFEEEAVASAATFAQHEQGEHDPEGEAQGPNNEMF
jgi:hypothetical protein